MGFARTGLGADLDRLPNPYIGQLVFVNINLHPDAGEIGNIEEDFPHIYILPLLDQLFDNNAAQRRIDGQSDIGFAGLFQCGDLAFLDPEQHQSLFGMTAPALPHSGKRN